MTPPQKVTIFCHGSTSVKGFSFIKCFSSSSSWQDSMGGTVFPFFSHVQTVNAYLHSSYHDHNSECRQAGKEHAWFHDPRFGPKIRGMETLLGAMHMLLTSHYIKMRNIFNHLGIHLHILWILNCTRFLYKFDCISFLKRI